MAVSYTVLHQLLELQVDTRAERVHGYAELQIKAPAEAPQIGLHSLQLVIDKVEVDGSPADFELQPYLQGPLPAVLSPDGPGHAELQLQAISELANDCFYLYKNALEKEDVPELRIQLPPAPTPMQTADQPVQAANESAASMQAAAAKDQQPQAHARAVTVRVDFHLDKPQFGMRFHGGYACSDNQVRRARAWFPCLDIPSSLHPWSLRFSVRAGEVAVGPGQLLKQTWDATQSWLTYHYAVQPHTPPCHIGLAVGPFAKLPLAIPRKIAAEAHSQKQATHRHHQLPDAAPDAAASASSEPLVLTAFAPPKLEKHLHSAACMLRSVLSHMSSLLAEDMPLGYLQQAFVPAEISPVGGMQLGLGLILTSADVLVEPTAVEQVMDAQVALADGIAQQWLGMLMQASPGDEWITTGLAAWLLSKYIGICFGNNEQQYRQWSEREAVYAMDSGHAAPLARKHARDGPWGGLHGTEQLSPALLSTWKASALMGVLEARIGKDGFKHVVELLTTDACSFLLGRPMHARSSTAGRMLSTGDFLKAIAKEGALKKEMGYFNNFCVKGRGFPNVTAAYDLANPVKKKRDDRMAELALRLQASSLVRKSLTATHQGLGHLKVIIREDQDTVATHHIPLPTSGPLLVELKMPARKPGYRPKHKKRKASAIDADEGEDGEAEGDAPAEEAQAESTLDVAWMAMEPHSAWAKVRVLQTERTCIAQLEHAHDLPIQLSAIEALQAMRPLSHAAVSALKSCLASPNTFCRVQIEAAVALGATASAATGFAGLEHLIAFYTDRCCEPTDGAANGGTPIDAAAFVQKAYGPAELATYLVLQAIPGAVASVRDQRGVSPVPATGFLLNILEQGVPQGGRLYDERATTAAFAAALGACHPSSSEVLQRAVAQLETCLLLEAAMPGSDDVIACAALSSLAALACLPPLASDLISRCKVVLDRHVHMQGKHHRVRRAAHEGLMRLAAATEGLAAGLHYICTALLNENVPQCRSDMLEDALLLLASPAAAKVETVAVVPSAEALRQLHVLLGDVSQPHVRHRAFMLLRRLGNLPPTLFRVMEEDETVALGPAASAETGITRGPAIKAAPTSAPAPSQSQAHTPPEPPSVHKSARKIKVNFGATSHMRPSASTGPRVSIAPEPGIIPNDEVRSSFRPAPSSAASPAPPASQPATDAPPKNRAKVEASEVQRTATPPPGAHHRQPSPPPQTKPAAAKAKSRTPTPPPEVVAETLKDVAAIMSQAPPAPGPPAKAKAPARKKAKTGDPGVGQDGLAAGQAASRQKYAGHASSGSLASPPSANRAQPSQKPEALHTLPPRTSPISLMPPISQRPSHRQPAPIPLPAHARAHHSPPQPYDRHPYSHPFPEQAGLPPPGMPPPHSASQQRGMPPPGMPPPPYSLPQQSGMPPPGLHRFGDPARSQPPLISPHSHQHSPGMPWAARPMPSPQPSARKKPKQPHDVAITRVGHGPPPEGMASMQAAPQVPASAGRVQNLRIGRQPSPPSSQPRAPPAAAAQDGNDTALWKAARKEKKQKAAAQARPSPAAAPPASGAQHSRDEHLPDEPRKAQAMPPGRPHFRAPPSGHGPNHGLHPGQSLQHQQLQPSPGSSPPGRRLTVKPPKSGARADVHATQQPADQGRNHLAGQHGRHDPPGASKSSLSVRLDGGGTYQASSAEPHLHTAPSLADSTASAGADKSRLKLKIKFGGKK